MIVVDDPDDARLDPFRMRERGLTNRLQRRAGGDVDGSRGLFVAEGDLVVERALAAGCEPVMALVDGDNPPAVVAALDGRAPIYAAGQNVRRAAMGMGVALDAVALFRRPEPRSVDSVLAGARRLVIVEAVDNPSNVGSIMRTAAALGWDGVVLDRTSADPLARRALRVSMGVAFSVPFARAEIAETLTCLRRHAVAVLALTPTADAVDISAVSDGMRAGKLAIAVGAERTGLSADLRAAAEINVRIPMRDGVDSLNAAAATAVALYALRA